MFQHFLREYFLNIKPSHRYISKFSEDENYFVYQGTLIRKGGVFIFLLGCKVSETKNEKVVEEMVIG